MRNSIILFLGLVLITSASFAQVVGGMNYKLEKLFMDEKYEDVAYKGMNMLEDDKYKKDPEIYLYVAMAWYEISQMNDEKMEAQYPDALRDALKYASKFDKKDKDGQWFSDNADFFENLKKAGIAEAAKYVDDEKKRRVAVGTYKYMTTAMSDDYNILFFKGVLEFMNRNSGQGERDIQTAMSNLVPLYASGKYKPSKSSAPVLEDGMVRYTEMLMQQNYADSAKKTIDWAIKFFPDSKKVAEKAAAIK